MARLGERELRLVRPYANMIFQDPFYSLDPRWTILDIVGEPLKLANMAAGKDLEDRVAQLMEVVGLKATHLRRYPHAFSGGQRQRIGVARALATNPRLIVADEPVSALDVSTQAQILNLLQDLQSEFGLSYLFIAHDLSVVEHISDRVAVMYVGKLVEVASRDQLFFFPKHPYTEALLSAVPTPDPDVERVASFYPAKSPIRLIRHRAAISIRAAVMRKRSVAKKRRCCEKSCRGNGLRVTLLTSLISSARRNEGARTDEENEARVKEPQEERAG